MPPITVVATITAQPGRAADLGGILAGMVPPTLAEAGCGRYDLHRDVADPGTFVFLEEWASREAHQAHLKAPHFLAARAAQEGLVASRSVRHLEKL